MSLHTSKHCLLRTFITKVLLLQNSDILMSSVEINHVPKRVFTEANFSSASWDFSAVFDERLTPPEGSSEQKPNFGAPVPHLKESTSTYLLQALSTQLNFTPSQITSSCRLKTGAD